MSDLCHYCNWTMNDDKVKFAGLFFHQECRDMVRLKKKSVPPDWINRADIETGRVIRCPLSMTKKDY